MVSPGLGRGSWGWAGLLEKEAHVEGPFRLQTGCEYTATGSRRRGRRVRLSYTLLPAALFVLSTLLCLVLELQV